MGGRLLYGTNDVKQLLLDKLTKVVNMKIRVYFNCSFLCCRFLSRRVGFDVEDFLPVRVGVLDFFRVPCINGLYDHRLTSNPRGSTSPWERSV